jgi:D-aspartate ligase
MDQRMEGRPGGGISALSEGVGAPLLRRTLPVPALVVGGIGIVRTVGVEGIPTWVGSDIPETVSYYTRHCRRRYLFPSYRVRGFIDGLVAAGKSLDEKIVLLTDDDRALLNISRHRNELAPYFMFNLPEHEIVEKILDKEQFPALADELGLPVPKTCFPKSLPELEAAIAGFEFPCILKPSHQEDWWHPEFVRRVGAYRKAIPCATREELVGYFTKILPIDPHMVVQELITGSDAEMYNSDCYLTREGKLHGYFLYRKHRSFPVHAGTGCFVETVDLPELRDLMIDIVSKLKMKGFCNIQFKRDSRTGRFRIIEIHARISIWEHLATIAGINLIAAGYHDILQDGAPLVQKYRTGVKGINLQRDIRSLPGYLRLKEWTIGGWLASLRDTEYIHEFTWDDPVPLFYDSWLRLRRLFKRLTGGTNRAASHTEQPTP